MEILGAPTARLDASSHDALVHRICSEFLEMPGLVLSLEQAARLFAVPPEPCARLLEELATNGTLSLTQSGRYGLARTRD